MSGEFIEQAQAAMRAHTQWKARLNKAIETGSSEFLVDVVRLDDRCDFGKWLHGQVGNSDPHYIEVKRLHAEFHVAAASVLALAVGGRPAEATAAMAAHTPFARGSASLVLALTAWERAAA
jgi:chemoreceptor zinc-binding protein